MPQLGEIRGGFEIGYNNRQGYADFVWAKCPLCGKERWVRMENGQPRSKSCLYCAPKLRDNPRGSDNARWKGGRMKSNGYIVVRLYPDDFFYSMVHSLGYVGEHRLVMARHLGRCLHPWEIVHHKNGIRDDNRIENLQLVTDDRHTQITLLENRIKYLEAENARLNKQLGELHYESCYK